MIPSVSIGTRTLFNDCNHSAAAIFWRSAIPPTRDSNRPGEIREKWNPNWRSRSLTGPRGRNRPGGGSREGAPIRPYRGGVAVRRRRPRPSDHARARVRGGQLALRVRSTLTRRHTCAGGNTRVCTWVRGRVRGPGLRPVFAAERRAARAGVTVVGVMWRQLRRGYATPATRRKPGRGSVVPRGCIPRGRFTPCLARAVGLSARGLPRVIVPAHGLRPNVKT